MPRKTKFVKGEAITSIGELAEVLGRNEYVYWQSRPVHPGWMRSMQFQTLIQAVIGRCVFRAVAALVRPMICDHSATCPVSNFCEACKPHEFNPNVCDVKQRCVFSHQDTVCTPYVGVFPFRREAYCEAVRASEVVTQIAREREATCSPQD
jgi:hypothetical protein